jgi:alkanesulfonate monooxygenase SsuD/methylene tetrahydromethanopterin reductase-like flavin-dependent oxidoreductase (luciferase family)
VAGHPTPLPDVEGRPTVRLAPGADLPPLVVGGVSRAAERRVVEHGAEWFLLPFGPDDVRSARARITERAEAAGVAAPRLTASTMVVLDGDPSVPSREEARRLLTDPRGRFGMPPEAVDDTVVRGAPAAVAEHLGALAEAGAHRIVVTVAVGDWSAQADLLAEAADLAGLLDGNGRTDVRPPEQTSDVRQSA